MSKKQTETHTRYRFCTASLLLLTSLCPHCNNGWDIGDEDDADIQRETGPDSDHAFAEQSAILDLDISKNRNSGLTANISFSTTKPTKAVIEVQGPDRSWNVGPTNQFLTEHSFTIFEMTPDTPYVFTVRTTTDDDEEVVSDPQIYQTEPLPQDFPLITLSHIESDRMAPGLTLFNVYRWPSLTDPFWGYAIAVDRQGRVVWYYYDSFVINDVKMMQNGNIRYSSLLNSIVEIDTAGNEVDRIWNRDLELDSIHHDVIEGPDSKMFFLSTEMRVIDGYPTEGDQTTSYNVIGDIIVELDSRHQISQTWNLFDYLDPMRITNGFHTRFWDALYNLDGVENPKDWSHANALVYDASNDSILVSVCHYDWIMNIERSTGNVLWRFGVDGDFLLEEGTWMYHQHAPEIQQNGNLLIYDNGYTRPLESPSAEPYSRVVEYEIDTSDPENLTARQVWEFRGESPYYSPFLGDANRLENGNILLVNGMMLTDLELPVEDPRNHKHAQIVEITYGDSPEVVFDLEIDDPDMSYTIYRATRIETLYSGNFANTVQF